MTWLEEGAPDGAVIIADHQTDGRGRWGRDWFSAPGASLLFSLILRPAVPLSSLGCFTLAAGVACAEAIEACTPLEARLKWPNDVMIGHRKVAGILLESRLRGPALEGVVVGVGVNLDLTRTDLPEDVRDVATSLATELAPATAPDRAAVLGAFFDSFEPLCEELERGDLEAVVARATARSIVVGERVALTFPDGRTMTGRAVRILESGALEVEPDDGGTEVVQVAEVRRLRPR